MIIKAIIEDIRAVFGVFKDFYEHGKNVRKARAAKFTGSWLNEGEIGGTAPSHYIDLTLAVDGTLVSGVITSRKLDDETFLGESSFTGKRRGYRIDGQVIKVSHRGVESYGDLRLDLRKNMLKLRGSKLVADFLPKEAVLWRDTRKDA